MKKSVLIVTGLIMLLNMVSAQAYEGTIQFDKKKQAAIVIDYSYPAEAVENAFIQKMEKLGYKAKQEKGFLNKDKGFIVFNNAYVTDISDSRMDYIIKVERKSRKQEDESVLYLILNKEDENALEKLDAYDVGRAKSFLNNLLPEIESANLELDIKAQQETVAKAEKKLRDLRDDQDNLEKKLKDNFKSQEDTQKDIEAQKKKLENLTGKRKQD